MTKKVKMTKRHQEILKLRKEQFEDIKNNFNIYSYTRKLVDLNLENIYKHITKCYSSEYFDSTRAIPCSNLELKQRLFDLTDSIHENIYVTLYDQTVCHESNKSFLEITTINDPTLLDTINTHFLSIFTPLLQKMTNDYITAFNKITSESSESDSKFVIACLAPIYKQLLTVNKVKITLDLMTL